MSDCVKTPLMVSIRQTMRNTRGRFYCVDKFMCNFRRAIWSVTKDYGDFERRNNQSGIVPKNVRPHLVEMWLKNASKRNENLIAEYKKIMEG